MMFPFAAIGPPNLPQKERGDLGLYMPLNLGIQSRAKTSVSRVQFDKWLSPKMVSLKVP